MTTTSRSELPLRNLKILRNSTRNLRKRAPRMVCGWNIIISSKLLLFQSPRSWTLRLKSHVSPSQRSHWGFLLSSLRFNPAPFRTRKMTQPLKFLLSDSTALMKPFCSRWKMVLGILSAVERIIKRKRRLSRSRRATRWWPSSTNVSSAQDILKAHRHWAVTRPKHTLRWVPNMPRKCKFEKKIWRELGFWKTSKMGYRKSFSLIKLNLRNFWESSEINSLREPLENKLRHS